MSYDFMKVALYLFYYLIKNGNLLGKRVGEKGD